MLPDYLIRFNTALASFNNQFPRPDWSDSFKNGLLNDFTFYSSRIEDVKLEYGDTIRFLGNELVAKSKLSSMMDVGTHKEVLESLIGLYGNFDLTESSIKGIHKELMKSEHSWDHDFKPELVGEYRNVPVIGRREPLHPNKEYVPHYNLELSMASYVEFFERKFSAIDNNQENTHLLSALAYFHNIFLNKIHPFADGNGRVCRIIMGTVMMKNNCPPIFSRILNNDDMRAYIEKIIECEQIDSDKPFTAFLANGMSEYMEEKVNDLSK
jgi:Fic family protein